MRSPHTAVLGLGHAAEAFRIRGAGPRAPLHSASGLVRAPQLVQGPELRARDDGRHAAASPAQVPSSGY